MGSGSLPERAMHVFIVSSYFASLAVFLVALALTYEGKLWVGPLGDVSSISMGSVAVIYALGQYRFRQSGYSELNSFVLAILFANAFLQCYELAYGLTFALSAWVNDPLTVTGSDVRQLILWLIMISPILLVRDRLTLRRTGVALLVLTGLVWVVWILYGFPQYYLSGFFFPQYLKTTQPFDTSLWLNFGSKALLGVFFVTLLDPGAALRAALGRLRGR